MCCNSAPARASVKTAIRRTLHMRTSDLVRRRFLRESASVGGSAADLYGSRGRPNSVASLGSGRPHTSAVDREQVCMTRVNMDAVAAGMLFKQARDGVGDLRRPSEGYGFGWKRAIFVHDVESVLGSHDGRCPSVCRGISYEKCPEPDLAHGKRHEGRFCAPIVTGPAEFVFDTAPRHPQLRSRACRQHR